MIDIRNHSKGTKKVRLLRVLALACLLCTPTAAHSLELSIPAGGTFDPFLLALKPGLQMSPLPAWMDGPATILPVMRVMPLATNASKRFSNLVKLNVGYGSVTG